MIEDKISQDLKTALLSKDELKVSTLRSLKSALLYKKVELNKRAIGLSETEELAVLAHEAKKRQESAMLYAQGGNKNAETTELAEKAIIEQYLPKMLSTDELTAIIKEVIADLPTDINTNQRLGEVIKQTKLQVGIQADGRQIATIASSLLN